MAGDEIIFGAVLHGAGGGSGGELWRHPDVPTNASVDINWYVGQAQQAEAAGFDFVFIVDSQFIDETFPPHHLNRLEPISLLSAVAARTERIGLAATLSTTYTSPWDIARRLASLDLISDGRAAWNIVTSQDSRTSANFGMSAHGDSSERYRKATESVEVVRKLWDSYEDDAFTIDRSADRFLDGSKLHRTDHVGEFYSVAGPLNIQRSRQGHPVLIQAGTSAGGRQLSAEVADVVFSFDRTPQEAEELARDILARAADLGRVRDDLRFIPALTTTIADTREQALAEHRATIDAMPLERRLAGLKRAFAGQDFSSSDLDRPLADVLPEDREAMSSTSGKAVRESLEAGRTLRQHLHATYPTWAHFVGTAEGVAAQIEQWVDTGWVDGFNYFVEAPDQWDLFRQRVVPILAEKGRLRTSYDSETLRGHLGLPFVPNRHARAAAPA